MKLTKNKADHVAIAIRGADGAIVDMGVMSLTMPFPWDEIETPDGEFTVETFYQHSDRMIVANVVVNAAIEMNRPDIRNRMTNRVTLWQKRHTHTQKVINVNTGVTYDSAAAAARAHGIAPSNMSNHLNGAAGYTTVKGHMFVKV